MSMFASGNTDAVTVYGEVTLLAAALVSVHTSYW